MTLKYVAFILQFIKSTSIAIILGPYLQGIWGFINLTILYLSYSNFGLNYSLNIYLSTNMSKEAREKYVSSSFILMGIISLFLLIWACFMSFCEIALFTKYDFGKYILLVIVITILSHINLVFNTIYRVSGKLTKIGIAEILNPLIILLSLYYYRTSPELIWYLLMAMIATRIFSLFMFLIQVPIKISPKFTGLHISELLRKGLFLLLYNMSSYMIMVSTRTIISIYYDVNVLGTYSFADNVSLASMLGLQTLLWIMYPKIINRLKKGVSNVDAIEIVHKIRENYLTALWFFTFTIITITPFVTIYLNEYEGIEKLLTLLILAYSMMSLGTGYDGVVIARHKEKIMVLIGGIIVIFNVIIILVFTNIVGMPFRYIILSPMISFSVYSYVVVKLGRNILSQAVNISEMMKIVFPRRITFPLAIVLLLNSLDMNNYYIIALLVYFFINKRYIISAVATMKLFVNNPSISDV